MESSGSYRSRLLTAGGVLSIIAGISQVVPGGALIVDFLASYQHNWGLIGRLFLPFLPDAWRHYVLWGGDAIPASMGYIPSHWPILGGCFGVLGIVAVVGGISAVRRRRFRLSLAGAICALASGLLGVLAVVFVALGKREFGVKA